MRRKSRAKDEALEELIGERDHIRIQMSVLDDGAKSRDVLNPIRDQLQELDKQIEARQRSIHGQSIW